MDEQAVPSFPRFRGPFKTHKFGLSTDREKGTLSFLIVYSQGSRHKVMEFLWLKLIWDELSHSEFELLYHSPEFLNDERKFAFLRACLILPKKILRRRLLAIEGILGIKLSSRERYLGMKSRLDLEIHKGLGRLPKVRKYSGYCKTPSSVGTKRGRGVVDTTPDSLLPDEYEFENGTVDWYNLLSVGDIPLFPGERSKFNHPDEASEGSETEFP